MRGRPRPEGRDGAPTQARGAFARVVCASALVLSWCAAAAPADAAGASVDDATSEQSAAASDKYRAGMGLFQTEKFAEALESFQQSYDTVASPNTHLMIVRTLAKLGKPAEAYAEIDSVIREAEKAADKSDKYKKTVEAARGEKDELKTKVGYVVVNVKASVTVAGRALEGADLGKRIPIDPGAVDVVLKLPSGEEERRHVDVKPGQESKVEIAPPGVTAAAPVAPPPAPCPVVTEPPPSGINQRTLALVAGGIGVAGFAAFTVFGLLDNGKYNDLKNGCANSVCSRALSDEAETGRMYQSLANVGLGVGIVGVASSVLLFVTAPSRPKERVAFRGIQTVALSPGRVSVGGSF